MPATKLLFTHHMASAQQVHGTVTSMRSLCTVWYALHPCEPTLLLGSILRHCFTVLLRVKGYSHHRKHCYTILLCNGKTPLCFLPFSHNVGRSLCTPPLKHLTSPPTAVSVAGALMHATILMHAWEHRTLSVSRI